ncbi:MAG: fibronectin type III domain-containing protein [Fimbriimonadales bacterium]|nr:fibronectin type III domain-containing protein [Fimbriimonadales bacterium]
MTRLSEPLPESSERVARRSERVARNPKPKEIYKLAETTLSAAANGGQRRRSIKVAIVPKQINENIEFYENRTTPWEDNATAIGLTQVQVDNLLTLVTAARNAYTAAQNARTAAKVATVALHNALSEMNELGAAFISTIRAKAEATANPNVYNLAQIPPPAPPSPSGIPSAPTNVKGQINSNGHVELSWKGSLAFGTFFSVWKKRPNDTKWKQIGAIAGKKFVDENTKPLVEWAMYQVFAHRSSGTSEGSEPITVFFEGQEQGPESLQIAA